MGSCSKTRIFVENAGWASVLSVRAERARSRLPLISPYYEIQSWRGIFMDTYYRDGLHVRGLEHAFRAYHGYQSRGSRSRSQPLCRRKTTSSLLQWPEIKDRTDVVVTGLAAEHALLSLTNSDIEIGDKIQFISGYSDMTVFLHDQIYGTRNDRVEVVWDILARGKKQ